VANADKADRVFAGLADGGEVITPLQATHWSQRNGLGRDPFGIHWKLTAPLTPLPNTRLLVVRLSSRFVPPVAQTCPHRFAPQIASLLVT